MVSGIEIKVDTKGLVELRDMMGRYVTKLPKAMNKNVKAIADEFVDCMHDQIIAEELKWTGELLESTEEVKEIGDGDYSIEIPKHGIYMDRMKPHWVSPYKHPVLFAWASDPNKMGNVPRVIFVRPRPWIDNAFEKGRGKIDEMLENGEFVKTLETEGKK